MVRLGRLAQRESIGLTSRGSSVQIGYRPLELSVFENRGAPPTNLLGCFAVSV